MKYSGGGHDGGHTVGAQRSKPACGMACPDQTDQTDQLLLSIRKDTEMTTITLNLPDDVYGALRKAPGDFAQELVLAATCHWYAQGQIAQDKAAEIAGLSRAEFIDELARRRIPVGQYSAEEVLEEVRRA